MQKIYVVNGLPLSGKTEFGKCVDNELRERGINFLHASSIDPIKNILMPRSKWETVLEEYGLILEKLKRKVTNRDWDGVTKDDYWRKAMSDLKFEVTNYNPNLIHYLVLEKIDELELPYVSFVDIREPENIEAFCRFAEKSQTKIKKVETILIKSDKSQIFKNNSDARVNELKYDIVIENPRDAFVEDSVALWFLRCRAMTFVEQEVLEGRSKERFY